MLASEKQDQVSNVQYRLSGRMAPHKPCFSLCCMHCFFSNRWKSFCIPVSILWTFLHPFRLSLPSTALQRSKAYTSTMQSCAQQFLTPPFTQFLVLSTFPSIQTLKTFILLDTFCAGTISFPILLLSGSLHFPFFFVFSSFDSHYTSDVCEDGPDC